MKHIRFLTATLALMGVLLMSSAASPLVSATPQVANAAIKGINPAQISRNLFGDVGLGVRADDVRVQQYGATRNRVASYNAAALASAEAAQSMGFVPNDSGILLNLFDDVVLNAVNTRIEPRSLGQPGYIWHGTIPAIAMSTVILTVGDGALDGRVYTAGASYYIIARPDGLVEISEIDLGAQHATLENDYIVPQVPATPPQNSGLVVNQSVAPASDNGDFIDVMVLWTPAARQEVGGTSQMNAVVEGQIATTNQTYIDSNVNQRVRLVYAGEVNYTEATTPGQPIGTSMAYDLIYLSAKQGETRQGITDNAGYMDNIHNLRDQYGADLVALLTLDAQSNQDPNLTVCGLGWLLVDLSESFLNSNAYFTPFSITNIVCASGYTFSHELGHNKGGWHDVQTLGGVPDPSQTITNAAFGYQDRVGEQGEFNTIMAYSFTGYCQSQPFGCTPIGRWSNPNQTYQGDPLGEPNPNTNQGRPPTNMVAALNASAPHVARYRASTVTFLDPPELVAPADNATYSDPNVTFEWNPVEGADTYKLVVKSSNKTFKYKFNLDAESCGVTCTHTPSGEAWLPPATQDLKWKIQAKDAFGKSKSETRTLVTDLLPDTIVLQTPADGSTVTNVDVTLTWEDDARIDEYLIKVKISGEKYKSEWTAAETICNGTTCSVDLSVNDLGFKAADGNANWKVDGRRLDASGKVKGEKNTSTLMLHTSLASLSPTESETVGANPTFSWEDNPNVTTYKFVLKKSDGTLVEKTVFTGVDICDGDFCSIDYTGEGNNLEPDDYNWKVVGKIDNVKGNSKTPKTNFTVNTSPPSFR